MTARHQLPPPPKTSPEEKARRFGELMAAALQRIEREKAERQDRSA